MACVSQKQRSFLNQKLLMLEAEKTQLQEKISEYTKKIVEDTRQWMRGEQEGDTSNIREKIDAATALLVDTYDVFDKEIGKTAEQLTEENHFDFSNETKDTTDMISTLKNDLNITLDKQNDEIIKILCSFQNELDALKNNEANNYKFIEKQSEKQEADKKLYLENEKKLRAQLEILKDTFHPSLEQRDSINFVMKELALLNEKNKSSDEEQEHIKLELKKINEVTTEIIRDVCKETNKLSYLQQSTKEHISKTESSYVEFGKKVDQLKQMCDDLQTNEMKPLENSSQFVALKEDICKLQWKTSTLRYEINVFLNGASRVGKSSTGNSIIRCNTFGVTQGSDATTQHCTVVIDDVFLHIYDPVHKVSDPLSGVINNTLIHVVIYVVRYGKENETYMFKKMKSTYENRLVNEHVIIVMSGGDEFYKQNPSGTFEDWCESQTGEFASMYKDCNKRIVLFDNVSTDPEVKVNQRARLITAIFHLPSHGNIYNIEQFGQQCKIQ
ncbi:uncharacterized protein LOC131943664 [Physella acuta]|uniref:uncharacterized protein LOC131943664 n=1 Tax=Physella acuta TaxID=109671 RepID=UPI0027DDA5F6|nr:uncharacterized protein LOC131943664 [Physella acuta]